MRWLTRRAFVREEIVAQAAFAKDNGHLAAPRPAQTSLRTPRRAPTGVALEAGAVAHQREVHALRAHLAFVALGFRFGAARGGRCLGVRLGERNLRFELLGGRELALGLRLERGSAGDFGARGGGGEGGYFRRPPSLALER